MTKVVTAISDVQYKKGDLECEKKCREVVRRMFVEVLVSEMKNRGVQGERL